MRIAKAKPCPFCGSLDSFTERMELNMWQRVCNACFTHGPSVHEDGREQEVTYTEIQSDTRNKRSVWEIATQPFVEAHFATFPEKLVEPCILAGSKPGDVVLDPFCGSGTTGVVALRYHRDFLGIELNPEYAEMAERRIDYIFIREQAGIFKKILSSRLVLNEPSVEGVYPSDHFGVMTEFSES